MTMDTASRGPVEGVVPLLSFEGTAYECGVQVGLAWQHALRWNAHQARGRWTPWWWKGRGGVAAELVESTAPFLVETFRGMAKGAEIDEALCGCGPIAQPFEACTSFAVHRDQTAGGHAIAGQTKDTGAARLPLFQVLRLRPSDAPGYLTLTYPGELFGHGFASPGLSVFRNSLYVSGDRSRGTLPFDAFGLLAVFSRDVEGAAELARRHGVRLPGHVALADARGHGSGLEVCGDRVEVIPARDGIYVHANHAVCPAMSALASQSDRRSCQHGASEHRNARLYELMERDRGRLTPQLALRCLSDHEGYPRSVCSHVSEEYHTTAAVIAEPSRGLLHVTRGAPCRNWPVTYRL